MKKVVFFILCALVLSGCGPYTKAEKAQLKEAGVYAQAKDCAHTDSVKKMLSGDFQGKYIQSYCDLDLSSTSGVNTLLKGGVPTKVVQAMINRENYHGSLAKRYASYYKKHKTKAKKTILAVNTDQDLEPYSKTILVKKDTDPAYLVNKFYALPKGYEPNDLEPIASVCTVGDTGCNSDELYLRKEANSAFQKMVKSGKKAHVKIVAISGYRTYDYQLNLWTTNAQTYGQDYADAYFARAGQSEHNTGLAVDITFNDHPFNEIENYKGYNWILKNMHKYGFILRYPKDKEKVTRYNYESWHLRYVGKKVAKTCFEKNWTLEEYWGNQ